MTTLVQWEPFLNMMDLRRRMDRVFDESMRGWEADSSQAASRGVALDVAENEQEYTIEASVPGIRPEEIDITINDSTLTISGESKRVEEREEGQWHLRERSFGRFSRSIRLPMPIDEEQIDADYEDGILTIHLPKSEKTKPKKISVKSTLEKSSSDRASNEKLSNEKLTAEKSSSNKSSSAKPNSGK